MKRLLGQILAGMLGGLIVFFLMKEDKKLENNTQYTDYSPPFVQDFQKANKVDNLLTDYSQKAAIDFTTAVENSIDAIVHVKTTYEGQMYQYADPIYEFFFGQSPKQKMPARQGTGSGVFVSRDGYIVTNNHVIDGSDLIEVTLYNGTKHKAQLIGADPSTDLALLKIEGENFPFIPYGNSDNVKVGEWVLALGNPFNLNNTVTAGIVSAKGRNINILASNNREKGLSSIESFIQTDAAVNPGNSGGALINTDGQLVGINTAIKSNTGSFTGYSFAIPVNIVKKVIVDLIEFGNVQRAFIGVSISPITDEIVKEKKLKSKQGIYINDIVKNGSAAEAGIKKGDIIKKIGNLEVKTVPELQEQLSKFRPGDEIFVSVERDAEILNFKIQLRNQFGSTELIEKETSELASLLGASFSDLTAEEKKELNIKGGLKVETLTAGKLRKSGVREGFIITKIDGKEINSFNDLSRVLEDKSGGVLIEGIYPNGVKSYYGIGI